MLWHIELEFCIRLCFNEPKIEFDCCNVALIFEGVMSLCIEPGRMSGEFMSWFCLRVRVRCMDKNLGHNYQSLKIELSCFKYVLLETGPFTWHHNFWHCDLDIEVWPTFLLMSLVSMPYTDFKEIPNRRLSNSKIDKISKQEHTPNNKCISSSLLSSLLKARSTNQQILSKCDIFVHIVF